MIQKNDNREEGSTQASAAPSASDARDPEAASSADGTRVSTPLASPSASGGQLDAYRARRRRNMMLGIACLVALGVLFLIGLGFGRSWIPPVDVFGILGKQLSQALQASPFPPFQGLGNLLHSAFASWGPYPDAQVNIVTKIRLPRVTAALLVGAALAISGASYQGLFKNPMVSPDILGASAGASFGAALALLWNFDNRAVQVAAFVLGFVAVALTYFSARRIGRGANQILLLVLCGLIVGTLFQAFVSAIKYTADPDSKLPEITYWLMGSIAKITWDDLKVFMVPFLVGAIPLLVLRWRLNTLSFGDEEAESLGVNVSLMRGVYILGATLLTSAVVAIAGVVGWVGLIIPHLVRFGFGPDNRIVLPMSLVVGAGFMVVVDMACRTLMASEIPLGILTSIIGAPFFFVILMKTRRGERS